VLGRGMILDEGSTPMFVEAIGRGGYNGASGNQGDRLVEFAALGSMSKYSFRARLPRAFCDIIGASLRS